MNQEPISRKPIIFRKIRPRYKKALIPALIISFIIAVILLLILNKYFFKPIFEKKGSLDSQARVLVMNTEFSSVGSEKIYRKAFKVQGSLPKADPP